MTGVHLIYKSGGFYKKIALFSGKGKEIWQQIFVQKRCIMYCFPVTNGKSTAA